MDFLRNVFCHVCLSTLRKLYPLSEIEVLPEWTNLGLNLTKGVVCWECKATMRKIIQFRKKALLAHKMIYFTSELSNIHCLSTLSRHTVNQYNETCFEEEDSGNKQCLVPVDFEIVKVEVEPFDALNEGNNAGQPVDAGEIKLEAHEKASPLVVPVEVERFVYANDLKTRALNNKDKYETNVVSDEKLLKLRSKERLFPRFAKAKFKCEDCVVIFENDAVMLEHNEKLHDEDVGEFQCDICKVRFGDDAAMEAHRRAHNLMHLCPSCPYHHYCLSRMYEHVRRNHDRDVYKCNLCDAKFRSRRSWSVHKRNHDGRCQCDVCDKMVKKSYMRQHLLTHDTSEKFECPTCQKVFTVKSRLAHHQICVHKEYSVEERYCIECNRLFKTPYLYAVHLKTTTKHNTAEFQCSQCERKFLNDKSLSRHVKIVHLKKYEHACPLCKKKFSIARTLKNHISLHHEGTPKPRKHSCDVCGKSFAEKGSLRQHMNSHTGAKPYKCDQCPSQFGYSSALYTHIKLIHLKQKRILKKKETS